MYKLVRKCLFLFDAEKVHYFSMGFLQTACSIPFVKNWIKRQFEVKGKMAETTFSGLKFKNPVGLGAGFDKNALYLHELEVLGFGFVEIGTVTPFPQEGNEKPRLFRLSSDDALINRMGFNNQGVKAVVERLKKWKRNKWTVENSAGMIVGGNIGKNKNTPNEDAWKDYETCFLALFDYVDYFVVNVSSPNTPGLRALQEKESLRKILSQLQAINFANTAPKPLLLKISPDLSETQLEDIIDLSMELKLDGLVVANTTISREGLSEKGRKKQEEIGAGGLSGKPLRDKSTTLVKYIHTKSNHQLPIIGSGGIFAGKDAVEKMNAGAALVQVWTGFIYEGPQIIKNICKAIQKK